MKLWLVKLRGMQYSTTGGAPYGVAYVLAETADEASSKLISYVDNNNLGSSDERGLKSIELIAENRNYPRCGMRLFV